MKIAIIGAGALGSYVGCLLADAGENVTLYDVRKDYVDLLKREGYTITQSNGPTKQYKPPITSDISSLGIMDAVIVATKCYHTKAAIEGAKSLIGDKTMVCSFQNGYGNLDVINEVVGNSKRIVAITTAHSFMPLGPTHLQFFLGIGGIDLGLMEGGVTPELEKIGEILKHLGVPVNVHDSGREVVWNKILWNAVLNCTAAVSGMDVLKMATTPPMHWLLITIADEYFAVSDKIGIKVWHPRNMAQLMLLAGQAMAKNPGSKPPKPSMLQDVEAGRPTEIDYINGAIVALGEQAGVPTPVNKTMVHLVKAIESKPKIHHSEH